MMGSCSSSYVMLCDAIGSPGEPGGPGPAGTAGPVGHKGKAKGHHQSRLMRYIKPSLIVSHSG